MQVRMGEDRASRFYRGRGHRDHQFEEAERGMGVTSMTIAETALRHVCDILASRQERFAWKTAKYLSSQLKKRGCSIDPKALDTLLIEHAKSPRAFLRYSAFPARNNLDTLWGHKALVGELASLPNLTLKEAHEFFGPCSVAETAPWCFLSHNYHDLKTVWEIRNRLIKRGYGVWVFEAEISIHAHIAEAVQEGLAKSDLFLVYASRYPLQSRWVVKEMLTALRGDLQSYVIVNWEDRELRDFFASWLTTGWANVNLNHMTDRLLADIPKPEEQVAVTDIVTLLQSMRDICPEAKRKLVLYAAEGEEYGVQRPLDHPHLYDFDTAFPCVIKNQ
jgi:hypothetical protein